MGGMLDFVNDTGTVSMGSPLSNPPKSDYYAILDSTNNAVGVLARKDFNNRVEVSVGYSYSGTIYRSQKNYPMITIYNRWATDKYYYCKPISKAEYETYIEFGIPDMAVETSWGKWVKSKFSRK